MSMDMKCYGLQQLVSDERRTREFLQHAVEEGKPVQAYSGVYGNLHYDSLQTIAGMMPDPETGEMKVCSGHVHSAGTGLWQCRVIRDITPEGSSGMDMRLLAEPVSGGDYTVIDVMNADIQPSYAPGEIIEMQVIAKSARVRFYPDGRVFERAEEQREIIPAGMEEASRPLREGYPMPLGYLARRSTGDGDDSQVYVRGTVRERTWFSADLPGRSRNDPERKLPSARIDTDFGELYIMVNPLYAPDIRSRSTISVLCSIQGDAMMGEYEDGMVINPKNDLMALRYGFSSGRMKRLRKVLSEGCSVYAETGEKIAAGRESAIEYLERRYEKLRNRGPVTALYGVTAGGTGERRCVAAGTDPEKEPGLLLYIFPDYDGEGRIRSFRLSGGPALQVRTYRSWIEMEEEELIRKGISPAILRKDKAFADYLNREKARDTLTRITCSMLDENVVLEHSGHLYEGLDRVWEFLEGVAAASCSEAGFRAQPAYISRDPELDFQCRPEDTLKGVALLDMFEETLTCYFIFTKNENTGKIDKIRGGSGTGRTYLIDYYAEWDPYPDELKSRICRKERTG